MTTHFKAPWGRLLTWVSALVSLIILGTAISAPIYLHGHPVSEILLAGIALPLGILGGSALFIVRGYTITADTLLIHRPLWDTKVSLAMLQSVESNPGLMSKSLRTCGNGGLYSFTGWYWNKRLGHYRAYVTDLKRTVVLRFITRRIVISPDDPAAFVEAMKPHLTPP
jgi:hypothetical protein